MTDSSRPENKDELTGKEFIQSKILKDIFDSSDDTLRHLIDKDNNPLVVVAAHGELIRRNQSLFIVDHEGDLEVYSGGTRIDEVVGFDGKVTIQRKKVERV